MSKRIKWEWNASKDDGNAKVYGYHLRVEQMGDGIWWWNVYPPGCGDDNARDTMPSWTDAPNKAAAIWAAECVFRQLSFP